MDKASMTMNGAAGTVLDRPEDESGNDGGEKPVRHVARHPVCVLYHPQLFLVFVFQLHVLFEMTLVVLSSSCPCQWQTESYDIHNIHTYMHA